MIVGQENFVTTIPLYVKDLVISLESSVDIDLKLYPGISFFLLMNSF